MGYIQASKVIQASKEQVFSLVTDLENIPKLLKNNMELQVSPRSGTLLAGMLYDVKLMWFGFRQLYRIQVDLVKPEQSYRIHKLKGPGGAMSATEDFEDHGDGGTLVRVTLDYSLPLGLLGALVDDLWFRKYLEQLLENRFSAMAELISQPNRPKNKATP